MTSKNSALGQRFRADAAEFTPQAKHAALPATSAHHEGEQFRVAAAEFTPTPQHAALTAAPVPKVQEQSTKDATISTPKSKSTNVWESPGASSSASGTTTITPTSPSSTRGNATLPPPKPKLRRALAAAPLVEDEPMMFPMDDIIPRPFFVPGTPPASPFLRHSHMISLAATRPESRHPNVNRVTMVPCSDNHRMSVPNGGPPLQSRASGNNSALQSPRRQLFPPPAANGAGISNSLADVFLSQPNELVAPPLAASHHPRQSHDRRRSSARYRGMVVEESPLYNQLPGPVDIPLDSNAALAGRPARLDTPGGVLLPDYFLPHRVAPRPPPTYSAIPAMHAAQRGGQSAAQYAAQRAIRNGSTGEAMPAAHRVVPGIEQTYAAPVPTMPAASHVPPNALQAHDLMSATTTTPHVNLRARQSYAAVAGQSIPGIPHMSLSSVTQNMHPEDVTTASIGNNYVMVNPGSSTSSRTPSSTGSASTTYSHMIRRNNAGYAAVNVLDREAMNARDLPSMNASDLPMRNASEFAAYIMNGGLEISSPRRRERRAPAQNQPSVSPPIMQPIVMTAMMPGPSVVEYLRSRTELTWMDVATNLPFVNRCRLEQPHSFGVLKLTNMPYNVTKPEIVAGLGEKTPLVTMPRGSGNYAIHILFDRASAKSGDCYVEVNSVHEAAALVTRYSMSGQRRKVQDRLLNVKLSSQAAFMKVLFPKARCVEWLEHMPKIVESTDEYSSGFNGFLSSEEMVMTAKFAIDPKRSRYSGQHVQRPYESMITLLFKYPWFAVHSYTLGERDLIFATTLKQVVALVDHLERGPHVETLTDALLDDLVHTALASPAFSEKQRAQLVTAARGTVVPKLYLTPFGSEWPFEVIGRRTNVTEEHIMYFRDLFIYATTPATLADMSDAEAIAAQTKTSCFGNIVIPYPENKAELTIYEIAAIELNVIDEVLNIALEKLKKDKEEMRKAGRF